MWRRRERGSEREREREKRAERGETYLKIEDRNLGKGAQRRGENEEDS